MENPDILAALATEPTGLKFRALIDRFSGGCPPTKLLAMLTDAIAKRLVQVHFFAAGSDDDSLVFKVVETSEAPPAAVLEATLSSVRNNTDNRGDFTNSETVTTAYQTLLRKYLARDIDAAVNVLIAEEVFTLACNTSGSPLWILASEPCYHTILAMKLNAIECFHVRSGTIQAANKKFIQAFPEHRVLAIMPNHVTVHAPGHHSAYPVHAF